MSSSNLPDYINKLYYSGCHKVFNGFIKKRKTIKGASGMNQYQLLDKLKEFGIFSQKDYHDEAFSRNIGLFTKSEQERLKHSKIAIPGMGGVG